MNKIKQKIYRTLKWSEKWTKTDMVYLAKGGFWVTMGQIVSSLTALGMSIAFAHYVEKEVYGTYKYILSIAGIFSIFSLSGMSTSVMQSIAKGYDGNFFEALKTKMRWGLIGSIVSLFPALYYYLNNNHTLGLSFFIISIFLPFFDVFTLYSSILGGRKDFKRSTIYDSITTVTANICLLFGLIFIKKVIFLIFIYFLSFTILRFFFYKITLKTYSLNKETESGIISFGKHLSFMNILGMIAGQLDKILVFHYLGATNLAIYSFAIALPEQIRGSYKNLFALSIPKFSTLPEKDLRKSISNKIVKLNIFTILVIVSYITIAPYIFKFIFPQYMESIYFSQIYCLSIITIPGYSLYNIFYSVLKKTKIMYILNFSGSILAIIISYITAKHFGLIGVIWKNSIVWCILLLISYYFYKRK